MKKILLGLIAISTLLIADTIKKEHSENINEYVLGNIEIACIPGYSTSATMGCFKDVDNDTKDFANHKNEIKKRLKKEDFKVSTILNKGSIQLTRMFADSKKELSEADIFATLDAISEYLRELNKKNENMKIVAFFIDKKIEDNEYVESDLKFVKRYSIKYRLNKNLNKEHFVMPLIDSKN